MTLRLDRGHDGHAARRKVSHNPTGVSYETTPEAVVYGYLVDEAGGRHPITLPTAVWEELDDALARGEPLVAAYLDEGQALTGDPAMVDALHDFIRKGTS